MFIEICNYRDYPIGGYLAFAKQMVTAFGNEVALVGMSSDDTPIGVWTKKEFGGMAFDFFSVMRVRATNKKSLVPGRVKSYLAVRKYRKQIFQVEYKNVFIQTPEVLFALSKMPIVNLCVRIPGVENPMTISRYWYGKYFARIFDHFYFRELRKANVVLASADGRAIDGFLKRAKGKLSSENLIQFPTRVNTEIFRPRERLTTRLNFGLDSSTKVIVASGRLSRLKGWEFLLESFLLFRQKYPDSQFIFLGDGEDRAKIEKYVNAKSLTNHVIFAGRIDHDLLARYLNASDLFVMGSLVEGWSTSLVEAISSAKPVVCTDFSSADELIIQGDNGYIVAERKSDMFCEAMIMALEISENRLIKRAAEMEDYAVANLKRDILSHWKLL